MDYNRSVGAYKPWSAIPADIVGDYAQPLLSDIEFNATGFMVLGFSDRSGHQAGDANNLPDGTVITVKFTKGEILIAYNNGTSYELEATGVINGMNGQGVFSFNGPGVLDAPGGNYTGQYGNFYSDNYLEDNATMGGLALRKDIDVVATTVTDPYVIQSAGIAYHNNSDGSQSHLVELYRGALPVAGFFGKAAGLGDIELLTPAPPLQIGNFVWADTDQDGVQDPNEMGLDGVTMELYDAAGNLIATTTTVNGGQYYFSADGDGGGQVWANAGDGLGFNTTYYVVAGGGGQFSGGSITVNTTTYTGLGPQDTGGGANADINDTDATIAGGTEPASISGLPFVTVTTGTAGLTAPRH